MDRLKNNLKLDWSESFKGLNKNNITSILLYKLYDDLYLNNIENKLVDILEDLYDNPKNINTVFNLYFLVKPDFKKFYRFDIVKINEHFNKYPLLGHKKISYSKFFEYHNQISK